MSERTFEHMGHTRKIAFPELSDEEMAGKVRMLTTGDWRDHEFVVCGARDRILALAKEKHELKAINAELLAACEALVECFSNPNDEWDCVEDGRTAIAKAKRSEEGLARP